MIAGLYSKSIFSFVRNCWTVFQSGSTILHSHQQWKRVPVATHPHKCLVLSLFWILTILISVQWYLTLVLICNSLMIYDVEHFFTCFFGQIRRLSLPLYYKVITLHFLIIIWDMYLFVDIYRSFIDLEFIFLYDVKDLILLFLINEILVICLCSTH